MIFIEPPSVYAERVARTKAETSVTIAPEQPRPANLSNEDYWTGIVFEILKLEGDIPVKIATLVSSVVKWGDFGTRSDREERKLELFRLIGRLIKEGRLRRIARNFVLRATVKRHQDSLLKTAPLVNFPKPNV